ncbi:MAG: hypothetical protein ACRD0G_17640 [Acidimicrobiales bacterium]
MRSRAVTAGRVLGAAIAFGAAWHVQLWLVVVGMTACAVALALADYIGNRARTERAAAWALSAPDGLADVTRLEEALVADLAAAAAHSGGQEAAGSG